MKESQTAYMPMTEHVPQSDELAFEGLRRHRQQVAAQKERDAQEQEAADAVRLKVLHDSRPH